MAELVKYVKLLISTHTLTWSVTVYSDKQTDSHANFNSHAHVERDAIRSRLIAHFAISTHTLTWSVTHSWALNAH